MNTKKEVMKSKSFFNINTFQQDIKNIQKHISDAILNHTPMIIYGPPGTGKTKIVLDVVNDLIKLCRIGRFESVQFHKKFSYEDFIEGFNPSANGFTKKDGVFKKFCSSPSDPSKTDVFLIDEINRAELAATFGETLFALEDRSKRSVVTAHFGDKFHVPENLALVGTMNIADRNIQNIDFAIRRRFRFIPLFPNEIELRGWLNMIGFSFKDFTVEEYCRFFSKINTRIRTHPLLGSHMQLGQSLFVPTGSKKPILLEMLTEHFTEVIVAQIEAYFGFGNERELGFIFNPRIADVYLCNRRVSTGDLVGLIKEVINEH